MKQLFLMLTTIIMTVSTHAQPWLDTISYPFESKFIDLKPGRMHYIDEGKGDVILFVHGTPTWSFLYRDFIKELSSEYRCIAIDHIGFGLSDKPENFDGKPESHAQNLEEFITMLGLENITLIVHDFGGPIGLGAANNIPGKIKHIISFNTWLWETKSNPETQKIDKIINSGMGKFLYLNMNFSPKVLLKKAFVNKKKLTKQVHQQYVKPFPTRQSRKSLLNIGKSLVGSSDWYALQWQKLGKLEQKPWLFLWGVKDPFINENYLEKWKKRLPLAQVKTFECGHFVQEEQTKAAIDEIRSFMVHAFTVETN